MGLFSMKCRLNFGPGRTPLPSTPENASESARRLRNLGGLALAGRNFSAKNSSHTAHVQSSWISRGF